MSSPVVALFVLVLVVASMCSAPHAVATDASPMDRLLPGDIILESASPDSFFQEQRISYGAHFTHASIYVGVRDGQHMVAQAVGAGKQSRLSPIEGKFFDDTYNTYQIVRVKNATDAQRQLAARIAETCFVGVPYGWNGNEGPLWPYKVRRGLDKNALATLYCSSLVWNAWKVAGVDLDSDYVGSVGTFMTMLAMPSSYFVMPDDIAMSNRVQYVIDIPLPKGPQAEVLALVPQLTGMSESEAKKSLASAGFRVKVVRRYDSSRVGTVVEQSPKAGYASKGSVVELVVSRGKDLVTVPDMFDIMYEYPGLDIVTPLADIEQFINRRLAGTGLRVNVELGDDIPGGYGQSPPKGSRVPRGTSIQLRILD